MSRLHPITVLSQVTDWNKGRVEIQPDGGLFVLLYNGLRVATCRHATALSNWALDKGAQAVRHDYDLGVCND